MISRTAQFTLSYSHQSLLATLATQKWTNKTTSLPTLCLAEY